MTPHRITLIFFALLGAFFFLQESRADSAVSFYGYEVNQPRWRSTKVPKTIQLAGGGTTIDPDGTYGTLGWMLPALSEGAGLPDFVSVHGLKAEGARIFQSPTYSGDIDDPSAAPTAEVDRIPEKFKGIVYQTPGQGKEAILVSIPLTGSIPPDFLVGIAFGNLASPQENAFATASFRASINDNPGTAPVPALGNDGVIDWIFFRVEKAAEGDTIHIHGTGGANGMASLAIITLDPAP